MEEKKFRILIVDDEADIRETVSSTLKRRGFEATAVASGEEAIEKIKVGRFDIVLLDINLPGIDGIAALEQIKKLSPETEVIIITGYGSIETAIESLKKGAYDFLEKPLKSQHLVGVIEKALDRHMLAEQVVLYEISKAIFSTIEFKELLKVIVELTTRVLVADDMTLMLLNAQGQLYIAISNGLSEQVQQETKLAVGERIAGWVAENRQPVILINGLQGDTRFNGIKGRANILSSMVIPLIKNNEVLGILTANRTRIVDNFNQSDLYKANIFASLVGLALDNSRLYEQLLKANQELVSSQKQLIQSTKLAGIGQLVSEMAHEVNNPLMVISGTAQLLLMEDSLPAKLKEEAATIVDECQRAKSIILRLLKFSRQNPEGFKEIDIHECINYLLSIIQHQFETRGIRVSTSFRAERSSVLGDERQLQEVMLNLLNNAKDAIANEGAIEIATSTAGDNLLIRVNDSGKGINPEVMDKLFSPYFTTKAEGTGLGLSICRTIMRNHRGDLKLESAPGKGTSALISLPLLKTV